jgi:hypothetical protein
VQTRSRERPVGTHQRQFVVDAEGRRVAVLLAIDDYEEMLERLEDRDATADYDNAIAEGGETIPFAQARKEIESRRAAVGVRNHDQA